MSATEAQTDVWDHQGVMSQRGGPYFVDVIEQVRRIQDGFVAARLPDDDAERIARHLTEIADTLAAHEVSPLDAPAGARLDRPARGHPLLPPFVVDRWTEHEVHAQVTFTPYFLGGNGAATGGAHAVLFNEILGSLSASGGRPLSRTAYVHINYRHVTPIGAAVSRRGEGGSNRGPKAVRVGSVARRSARCRRCRRPVRRIATGPALIRV